MCTVVSGEPITTAAVDLRKETVPLEHFLKVSVGSGHARLGLRADWQQQLTNAHRDLGIEGVRFHGSFDDDMGPVVTAIPGSADVKYNFTLLDQLWDAITAAGVNPIVELSFMPQVLANCAPGHCHTTMHYKGITTPPKSYDAWGALVKEMAEHVVNRYGLDTVANNWRFEVWNEEWGMPWGNPDTRNSTDSPYMGLYNASYHALKAVSPLLRVGGPATAEVRNVGDFVKAIKTWDIDADFVSTHLYPTDFCNSMPNVS
jgi:xylan 1,4-beta-xylosidase